MAFSAVTWAFKDVVTSAKLAQMVENIVKHDHRADGTQGDGVGWAVLALAAGWSGSVGYTRRAGILIATFTIQATSARPAANAVGTLPVGFRPSGLIYFNLSNIATATNVELQLDNVGLLATQPAVASGVVLRGTIVVAVG